MAPRDDPPFRADHVGSLLRPPELLQAREDHAAGRVDDDELRAVEDAAIRDVVKLQRDVGLRTVTDGEFRRASWHMDFIYSLDGVSKVIDETLHVQFRNEQGTIEFAPPSLHVDGRIGLSQTIFGDAFEFLRSCASDGQLPKLTIPSPSMVHYRGGRAAIDESLYQELDGFWADLVATYREEVRRLAELGCTYLQFADTSLAYLNDPAQREHVREIGGDAEHQHEAYIRHINEALADRPQGLAVTTHMCRGNFRSSWVAEGLRLRRRGAVRRARGRRLLHGVGRRPLGRVRAAALRPARQGRRPRPRDHEARRARGPGDAPAPDRRGVAARRPRPAVPVTAVRVLLDRRGQCAHARAAGGQAAPGGGRRAGGLGLEVGLRRKPHVVLREARGGRLRTREVVEAGELEAAPEVTAAEVVEQLRHVVGEVLGAPDAAQRGARVAV